MVSDWSHSNLSISPDSVIFITLAYVVQITLPSTVTLLPLIETVLPPFISNTSPLI